MPACLKFLDTNSKRVPSHHFESEHLRQGVTLEVVKQGEKSAMNAKFDKTKNSCPSTSQTFHLFKQKKGMNAQEVGLENCIDSLLVEGNNLTDIYEGLFFEADTSTTIQFLKWIRKKDYMDERLEDIYFATEYYSFFDFGLGYHREKGEKVFEWMIKNYPQNTSGYKGMLLTSYYLKRGDIEFYCRKIMEIDPNFQSRQGRSILERKVSEIISKELFDKKG